MSYVRFGTMVATSTFIMFGLMYLNTDAFEHVMFSQTRMWKALLMGATMAFIMLLFMWGMYKNTAANIFILIGAAIVFATSLWLARSQETVGGVAYMRAMIPHHSIAVLTSTQAHIRDQQVRELADGIIEAQVREIAQMKRLIAELETRDPPPHTTYRHCDQRRLATRTDRHRENNHGLAEHAVSELVGNLPHNPCGHSCLRHFGPVLADIG